jgi:hypothetical protein
MVPFAGGRDEAQEAEAKASDPRLAAALFFCGKNRGMFTPHCGVVATKIGHDRLDWSPNDANSVGNGRVASHGVSRTGAGSWTRPVVKETS